VGVAGKPQVILSAAPHTLPTEPFRLQVSKFRVDQDSEFRRIKTISYAIHAVALKRARVDGFDDALMLNKKGHVAEVTTANIFWRRGNRIYTPPVAAGCLEGVTRYVILRAERNESFERMVTADEVFVASSLKLALGVIEIADGRRRYNFAPGPATRRLAKWLYDKAGIMTGRGQTLPPIPVLN
jgi:branched-chain amino acid aminotransferase